MDYIAPIPRTNNNKKVSSQTTKRSPRSDKKHPVKFPTDSILNMKLRTYRQHTLRIIQNQGSEKLEQTDFNTLLLRYGLKNLHLVDWTKEYQDTKKYMTTKLLETEYKTTIGGPYGLSIQKGLSDRKVVYYIVAAVVEWLEKGGNLEEII